MKLKRFHVNVYCPEWSREAVINFSKLLSDKKLTPSLHAIKKYRRLDKSYKKAVKELINGLDIQSGVNLDFVFEFYANKDNVVKKVCYRFPTQLANDIILVISSTGKIVTIYTNGNFNPVATPDESLYEKGETKDVI